MISGANDPLVSVLMSCYNGEPWLREAIESVLGQSVIDFEFIVIDDGSKDRTWEIIREYAAKDSRIVAHTKANSGLADTLNLGLSMARGKWLARMDQDDICEPRRLEAQLAYVQAHPETILLGSGFAEINSEGLVLKLQTYPRNHGALVRHLERAQRYFPHSSAFYRLDKALQVGGYTIRFRYADDYRLWLDLSRLGKSACLVEPLVKIRKHPGQMSLDANGRRQIIDRTAAIVCHFLKIKGEPDPATTADVQKWADFILWIETALDRNGYFRQQATWVGARQAFFSSRNKLAGLMQFSRKLLASGHAWALLWAKLFGSRLGQRLAKHYIQPE